MIHDSINKPWLNNYIPYMHDFWDLLYMSATIKGKQGNSIRIPGCNDAQTMHDHQNRLELEKPNLDGGKLA